MTTLRSKTTCAVLACAALAIVFAAPAPAQAARACPQRTSQFLMQMTSTGSAVHRYTGDRGKALFSTLDRRGLFFGQHFNADAIYVTQPNDERKEAIIFFSLDGCVNYAHIEQYRYIVKIVDEAFGRNV